MPERSVPFQTSKKGVWHGCFPQPRAPPPTPNSKCGFKKKTLSKRFGQNFRSKRFGQNFRSKLSVKTFRSKRFGQNLLAPKPLTISINPKPQTLNPKPRNPETPNFSCPVADQDIASPWGQPQTTSEGGVLVPFTVEARKLEHHYPHALKVKYKGS